MEIGFKSGLLTYVEEGESIRRKTGGVRRTVKCLCICGEIATVHRDRMLSGKAVSCGCSRVYNNIIHPVNVGSGGTKERYVWSKMKSRCLCSTDKGYVNYGGRGITICEKWLTYSGFIEDMGSTYKEGLSLDRIDNNGNYCKENCRWADRPTQAYNKRKMSSNKSGKIGVHWDRKSNRWVAKFSYNNNVEILGRYKYLWDAIYVRLQKEQETFGYVKD